MQENTTKIIGVCVADISTDYNDRFFEAFKRLAHEFHFKVLFFSAFSPLYWDQKHDIGEGNIYQLIDTDVLDGLIMLTITIKNELVRESIIEHAKKRDIPVISIEYPLEGSLSIIYEYKSTIRKLLSHLIDDHGYRRINFIAGPKDNLFSEERLQVYRDVLTEHQIPVEEARIGYGDFWYGPTHTVVQSFIYSDLPMPEAIVCANDSMAIAAIQYLTDHGYNVPEDVAVTGFDGIEEALDFYPPITTVRYDIDATISRTFRIMRNLLQGKEIDEPLEIVSEIVYGSSCGCQSNKQNSMTKYNNRTHKLHSRLNDHRHFSETQIYMAADLTDNDSFFGVFNNLMQYADEFRSNKFWLCIVDDFLVEQEELSDIIDKANFHRSGYSDKMNIMLSRINGEWQGLIDFNTSALLPNLSTILEDEDALMFCPLHVLDMTIGYVVLAYDSEMMNMEYLYQFLMNISNALENTKTHQRQQNIISSLENKYIHDPMTGLFNRRGFYQRVQPLFEQCAKTNTPFVLVSADLNGLKTINDTYGHADGDIAISTVGQALAQESSASATCARFGGDEFVAAWACNSSSSEEEAAFRKRIQNYLDEFNASSGKPYTISSSLGIVVAVPSEDITLDEFIKVTDEKMYEEKVKYHQTHKR